MKHAFYIVLLMVLPAVLHAQSDTTYPPQPDPRIIFQSKVRQLTSYLNEGNESAAKTLFKDVSGAMNDFITANQQALDTATGANKRKLKDRLDRQRQLMGQFQSFQPNIIRNRESIDTWTQQFVNTLYP
ncbi:MAG: hypothetical protein K8F30_00565 [Taibaiella sp.]|nr:hypothetical protein [Taibaiella sp.]